MRPKPHTGGGNKWHVDVDAKDDKCSMDADLLTAKEPFVAWAHHMGIRRLRHLRDFTLAVDLCHKPGRCSSQEFRIQFDEQRGLSLLDVELEHQHEDVRQDVMSWQLAATELRRTSLVWKGEGIMDFFMENNVQEFWSSSCFTYSWASEEEQMEIYEREELGREWLTIG